MLISVVIPSFNRPDTVCQAIDSILAQNVDAGIEIVIGDDCSDNHTKEVLLDYKNKYPEIIRLIFHEHSVGLGANWAICVNACKGSFICNCDDDDYWHNPGKLQIQLDFMKSHPHANVVFTDYRTHNRSTGKIKEYKSFINRQKPLQQAFWIGEYRVCNASVMYRTAFLKQHIPLDDYISHHFSLQDWPTWIILSAYSGFDEIGESTATFGIETKSITRPESVAHLKARFEKDKDCYDYLCSLFPEELKFDSDSWSSYMNERLLAASYTCQDYESAKYYSGLLRNKNTVKTFAVKNKITFHILSFLIDVKRRVCQ